MLFGSREVALVWLWRFYVSMAFAVPNHLPRHAFSGKDQSLGSTSKHYDSVITKVAEASFEGLNSTRASSWVSELTKEIDQTRVCNWCIPMET